MPIDTEGRYSAYSGREKTLVFSPIHPRYPNPQTAKIMAHKVLVIDDEAGFTKLLKMNLEKSGEFEVRIENNSMKALAAAREFHPDVILLDVVMPGLDGGDVAAQFQEDPILRQVPVIMLTALVSPGETSQDAVAQSGSLTVLPKPVNIEKLMNCLTNAIATT